MKAVRWDIRRLTMYGAAAGIIYAPYLAVDRLGVNPDWNAWVVESMIGGAVGGAILGALIAGARNFLAR